MKVIFWLVLVAHRIEEGGEGGEDVKRVPHANEHLVRFHTLKHLVNVKRVVRFCNPDPIVDVTLAFHALELQRGRDVNWHGRPGCNASDLLDILSQERVSRARIRGEGNMVLVLGQEGLFLVQEMGCAVPEPGIVAKNILIFALEDGEELGHADCSCLCCVYVS